MSLRRSGLEPADIAVRIEESAAILNITPLLDKLPSELSGGERQRVATAKAIVRNPAAFLLDEPLAALDAALRLTLRSELVNLQKRLHTTMVFVTHDQIEAMTMGDRIAVVRDGRLDQIGTPDEIYNCPETLFVASFVGSPPMNFFLGERIEIDSTAYVRCGLIDVRVPDGCQEVVRALPSANVTVAVRPQHIRILGDRAAPAMPMTVFSVEHLGKELIIIFDGPNGSKVRAIVEPGFHAQVGDRLYISFRADQCIYFDSSSGRVINSFTRSP